MRRKKEMRQYTLSFAFALVSIACATSVMTVGRDFDITKVDQIQKGKTTQQEILNMFGVPWSKTTQEDSEIWSYGYTKSVGRATSFIVTTSATAQAYSKNLIVTFDSLGITKSFSHTVSGDTTMMKIGNP